MKSNVSAKKAVQVSTTETGELMGDTKEKNIFLMTRVIDLPCRKLFFKQKEKIGLVFRPDM